MTDRLVEVQRRERWTGGKELVAVDRDVCPLCGGEMSTVTITEAALLRHGGYGAARTTIRVWCDSCGWSLTPDVTESSPRG